MNEELLEKIFLGSDDEIEPALNRLDDASNDEIISTFITLFNSPERYLKSVSQFLERLDSSLVSLSLCLGDKTISDEKVRMLLDSIREFFKRSILSWKVARLGAIYMFWDALCFPWSSHYALHRNVDYVVAVLVDIYKTENIVCMESAIHGLNHIDAHQSKVALTEILLESKNAEMTLLAKNALDGKLQ
jgi:hypothetical protein